ncbi:MAG: ATP-grasp domain-containing protein [Bdellovibrionales bacterium]|nr:ATP-grasp domain-containing protein [Bdellovibrionales bacterium]
MRPLRILIVTHDTTLPPEGVTELPQDSIPVWKTEFDVEKGLRSLGHEIRFVGLRDDLAVLRAALEEFEPHIAFNMIEEFSGVAIYDQNVISYLELLRVAFTGCNPRGLLISHDKVLTKKILSYHRIPTPRFGYSPKRAKAKAPTKLRYPLVVKSATEHASRGISQASVVASPEKCVERIQFIHERIGTDAVVEEFVEGRELYVSMIGNERLTIFPTWELDLSHIPEGRPKIATERMKFNRAFQDRHRTDIHEAVDLDPAINRKIQTLCKRAFRRLYLSGYARFDIRLTAENEPYILEANANPSIGFGEEFSEAANGAGLSYPELLSRIVGLGLSFKAPWTGAG